MSFVVQVGHAQVDGRKFVLEVHTDIQGEFARIEYLADPAADFNMIAAAREAVLRAWLADQEAQETVDNDLQPNPRFQMENELLAKVRVRYFASTGEQTCRIARWIVNRLNDGSVTVVQRRTAFNVSAGQWNAINGRMDTFAVAIGSVDTAVGE